MNTSEQIGDLVAALSAAQGDLTNPPKNKTNPHFNSKYVDLSDGLEVIRKTFSKHKLAFMQATKLEDGMIVLYTRLMHPSGQWIESTYPVCGLDKHQAMGSALTYARRYTIFAMAGVAGEDDDDGNTAAEVKAPPKRAPKPVEPSLSPEDSANLYETMLSSLNMVSTMQELNQWAKENQGNKVKLTPIHQQDLTVEFRNVETMLRA